MDKKQVGREKEELAAAFLSRHGFSILERNYSCRAGEIDIVAQEGDVLCFVEVKYRTSTRYGYPEENVGARKQRKISVSALCYLRAHGYDGKVRFDVVSILPGRIRLIRNAYYFTYD